MTAPVSAGDSHALDLFLAWLAVVLFSILVAVCELISRFRDAPIRLGTSPFVWLYCAVNALAAAMAFELIRVFGWTAGLPVTETSKIVWIRIASAGFSAMVLLRSSLLTVRSGNQDVDVGPGAVLQQLLTALDREIDRREGQLRLLSVDAFQGLDFAQTSAAAPALCAGVLQSLTADQQAQLKRSIDVIIGGTASSETKLRLLALELMNVCGPDILNAVAKKLRDQSG